MNRFEEARDKVFLEALGLPSGLHSSLNTHTVGLMPFKLKNQINIDELADEEEFSFKLICAD